MKVFIKLDDLPGPAWKMATNLLKSLGIETDYWSRFAGEISDEQAGAIRQFEEEHLSAMSELTEEEFRHCREVRVRIGRYCESSWQR